MARDYVTAPRAKKAGLRLEIIDALRQRGENTAWAIQLRAEAKEGAPTKDTQPTDSEIKTMAQTWYMEYK